MLMIGVLLSSSSPPPFKTNIYHLAFTSRRHYYSRQLSRPLSDSSPSYRGCINHISIRGASHTTCFSSDVTFPLPTDSPSPHQIIPHFTLTLVVVVVVVVAVLVEQAWLFHHWLIHNCDGSSSYIYSYTCRRSSSIFSKGMAIPSSTISPRPNHHSLSPLTLVVMVVVVVVV